MAPSDAQITLKIDGHPYTLRPTDVTAWHSATFEAETGYSIEGMIAAVSDPAGRTLTMIARFAYLSALVSGQEPRSFREVAERISFGSDIGEPELSGIDDEPGEVDEGQALAAVGPEPELPPEPGEDADPQSGPGSSAPSPTAPAGSGGAGQSF